MAFLVNMNDKRMITKRMMNQQKGIWKMKNEMTTMELIALADLQGLTELASKLTSDEERIAFGKRFGELSARNEVSASHAQKKDGDYEISSLFSAVRPDGDCLRLCEDDDPMRCGFVGAIYGHSFLQQKGGNIICVPTEEVARNVKREDGSWFKEQVKLDWTMGGWILRLEMQAGNFGPVIPEIYFGHIGNQKSANSNGYSVGGVGIQARVASPAIEGLVESILTPAWGFHGRLKHIGDRASATAVHDGLRKIGAHTTSTSKTGDRRFTGEGSAEGSVAPVDATNLAKRAMEEARKRANGGK